MSSAADEVPINFSSGVLTYEAEVDYEVTEVVLTPVPRHKRATVAVAGIAVEKGRGSAAVPLQVGDTTVAVVVTGEDGTTRTYEITVERLQKAREVEVRENGFVLTCPAVVSEGTTVVCHLTNTNGHATRYPVIAISHRASNSARALVSRDSRTTTFSQDVGFTASQIGEHDHLEIGYGEMFSGDSISQREIYGYQKFNWTGDARSEGVRDVKISIAMDDLTDDKEVFYVGLAPGDHTGLKRLVRNTAPIVRSWVS